MNIHNSCIIRARVLHSGRILTFGSPCCPDYCAAVASGFNLPPIRPSRSRPWNSNPARSDPAHAARGPNRPQCASASPHEDEGPAARNSVFPKMPGMTRETFIGSLGTAGAAAAWGAVARSGAAADVARRGESSKGTVFGEVIRVVGGGGLADADVVGSASHVVRSLYNVLVSATRNIRGACPVAIKT